MDDLTIAIGFTRWDYDKSDCWQSWNIYNIFSLTDTTFQLTII